MSKEYIARLEEYREKASKLEEYSQMISHEDAETWYYISQLFGRKDYVSDTMKEALYLEIDYQLNRIEEEYEMIETEVVQQSVKYKELRPKF